MPNSKSHGDFDDVEADDNDYDGSHRVDRG